MLPCSLGMWGLGWRVAGLPCAGLGAGPRMDQLSGWRHNGTHTQIQSDTKDTVLTQALVQNVKVNNGTRRDCLMCWEEKTRENLVAYLAGGAEEAPGRSNIDRVSVQRDGSVK